MDINFDYLKDDLHKNRVALGILKKKFPNLKRQFRKYEKSPTCVSCYRGILEPILSSPSIDKLLKTIYGPESAIDTTLPSQKQWVMDAIVEEIEPSEYAEWFKTISKNPGVQIRNFSTYLDTNKNKVVFSAQAMVVK